MHMFAVDRWWTLKRFVCDGVQSVSHCIRLIITFMKEHKRYSVLKLY